MENFVIEFQFTCSSYLSAMSLFFLNSSSNTAVLARASDVAWDNDNILLLIESIVKRQITSIYVSKVIKISIILYNLGFLIKFQRNYPYYRPYKDRQPFILLSYIIVDQFLLNPSLQTLCSHPFLSLSLSLSLIHKSQFIQII